MMTRVARTFATSWFREIVKSVEYEQSRCMENSIPGKMFVEVGYKAKY